MAHSNDRRKQKCSFCNELLKTYRDIEVQNRTGWLFHIWCKQAIDLRRTRQGGLVKDMFISQNFIHIYGVKIDNLLVYQ
jgi:hypothetical protein